ncbi:glycerate kinase [Frateuria aurantia]
MRILIAPDSYKESLSAAAVAAAIEAGFREIWPQAHYRCLPMADGGEGTVDAMLDAMGGHRLSATVSGPLGELVLAEFGLLADGRTAVMEMAAASGLALVAEGQRNPLEASSRGTGELIGAALDAGARHLILGIGGSATNDGGCGAAQALGVRFLDAAGTALTGPPMSWLDRLARIDVSHRDPRLAGTTLEVACDVDNPLLGPNGASAIFGPQKGADPAMVAQLDQRLACLADRIAADLAIDVHQLAGGGAAGGMGAGAVALLGGHLRSGVEIVSGTVDLAAAVREADLVVTGEGRIDGQSIHGKTPVGVAKVAKQYGRPVIAIAGALGEGYQAVLEAGIDAVFSTANQGLSRQQMFERAATSVQAVAREIAAGLRLGTRLSS